MNRPQGGAAPPYLVPEQINGLGDHALGGKMLEFQNLWSKSENCNCHVFCY